MTDRERFLAVFQFRPFDRCPMWEMGPWQATLDRWRAEGWDGEEKFNVTYRYDHREHLALDRAMLPRFERRVLEDDGEVRLVVDERGVTCRELVQRTETSMPNWIEFPVKDRATWEEMKRRYDPRDPQRYPADYEDLKRRWAARDYPLQMYGGRDTGFFGPVRGWMGAERAMLTFYDDPGLIHEMMELIADFTIEVMRKACAEIEFDSFFFWEDMAFKTASLISPAMFREFMLPRYQKVTAFLRSRGIPIIMVDSDGYVDELLPLWIEGGVNMVYPFEVAAGEDVVALRQRFPRLGMNGGIDKRALAKDRAAIDAELARVMPLIETGGYVPTVDHGLPPDIPLDNFRYYMERKWEWIERIGGEAG